MKIKTDKKWKDFKHRVEVPDSVLEDEFDYIDDDVIDGFIRYRGDWYHLSQFMMLPGYSPWDGVLADSMTTGLLIEMSSDGEQYRIGSYRT